MAVPLCVGLTFTLGGIVIDGDGRALRADRSPIDGLYAAGAATAGCDGRAANGDVSYVGGLVKAVFGLRAAEHAAHALERVRAQAPADG